MNQIQNWIILSPEITLTVLILIVLFSGLNPKTNLVRLNRISVLGSFLIFSLLVFLWSSSGVAFYGAFEITPLTTFFKMIFLFAGILTLVMTGEYFTQLGKRSADFILLVLFSVLGCFFLASSTDLITLFITIEWLTISLYVLTAYLRTDSYSLEAGTKYLIMGAFSAAIFLYGISFIYGTVGGLRFDEIHQALTTSPPSGLFLVGLLLILAGIGFKIAAFPFQLWAPDVYQGAPTPVTGFLSVGSKTAGFAALLKVFFVALGLGPNRMNWSLSLSVLAAATLLYGNLGALGQTNMKRLFAYSSMGHAGYLLIGLAAGTYFGAQALLFYLAAYAIANLTAFLVITIANRELESGELSAYRGLAKKSPFLAGVFFIALLSLGGIPPLVGFFGKFLILQAVILKGYLWLAILGAINVIVSLYYYLTIIKGMYFAQAGSEGNFKLARSIQILFLILTAATILLGFLPGPLFNLASVSAQTLFSTLQ